MTTPVSQTIRIETTGQQLVVRSPYDPQLPARAKALGGRFGNSGDPRWTFDVRDEARVREMLIGIYGTDGSPVDLMTIQVALDNLRVGTSAELRLGGRAIAERRFRDSAVRLGGGVILINGGFAASGGSARNPSLSPRDGTVLEVRDLPAPVADALIAEHPEAVTIVTIDAADEPAPGPLAHVSDDDLIAELTRRGYTVARS